MKVLFGERIDALDRHGAHDVEPLRFRREVDERDGVAVDVAGPSERVRGLDLQGMSMIRRSWPSRGRSTRKCRPKPIGFEYEYVVR